MNEALVKAEQRARANGYTGLWPPPPKPRVDTPEDLSHIVDQVLAGDRRANLLWQVAVHAGEFFNALAPRQCADLALQAVALAEDPATARRVRIRAIQAVIRPLIQLIQRVRKLERVPAGDKTVLAALEANIAAFVGALGSSAEDQEKGRPAPLVRLAKLLYKIGTESTGEKGREDQVRAITTAMDLTTHMMDAIISVRGDLSEDEQRERKVVTAEEIERAHAQFTALEVEARRRLEHNKGTGDDVTDEARNHDD